ncbi:Bcr/CflA family efflux MFS transporter [Puteibacter caeruleilacunae]|nr:Bcr/CflA family efflux MFS transporter [Puteibacter caeruleilacunae]
MIKKKISQLEFISLMASLMALSSLSIDALLPGLKDIAGTIGISNPQDNQLLITMIFMGLGFGQLISGTLSDSLGRKPAVCLGYLVFALASLVCVFATSLEMIIIGRLLQGFGLSAPRSISIAIIRDKYSGNYMAKVMSFVSVIFILAPIVAPSLGKLLLDSFGWQSIFYSQVIYGAGVITWLWQRQPETLKEEDKKPVRLSLFIDGTKEFFKHKQAVIYTFAIGISTAPFLAYISASQQIFQVQYGLTEMYPYIFSGLAITIGLATYLNGTFVVRFGMLKMVTTALITLFVAAGCYILLFAGKSNPSSFVLIFFLGMMLFSTGFIMGNMNALAMQPVGHIAGIGAAIVGFISTIITVPLATIIGRFIDATALPIFIGFMVSGALSFILIQTAKSSAKNTTVSGTGMSSPSATDIGKGSDTGMGSAADEQLEVAPAFIND